MVHIILLLFLTLLGPGTQSLASPTSALIQNASDYRHPPNGLCTDYTVKQHLTTENYVFNFPPFTSNFDLAALLFNLSRKDSATVFQPIAGTVNITKEYEVEGTFCTPKVRNGREGIVLLASAGATFDRRYWASSFQPDEYGFVDFVLDHGYSIFYYDRINTGKSPNVSGNENQASNQVAFLGGLAKAIRDGSYTSDISATKIVLLGHSLGSYLSGSLLTTEPSIVDGAVLTGFAYPNATDAFRWRIGGTLSAMSLVLSDTDPGTILSTSVYGVAEGFFRAPFYSIAAIEYAFSITTRSGVGELATIGTIDPHAPGFKGPVLLTTGENDMPACGGECVSTFEGGLQEEIFPGASPLETYLHPEVGHLLNLEKNATGFYDVIVRFLDAHF